MPEGKPNINTTGGRRQAEAMQTYKEALLWTQSQPNWIMVGDFNETRDAGLDRCSVTPVQAVNMIEKFLKDTGAVDLWRTLHPNQRNGHTRRHHNGSTARLDYVLLNLSKC